MDSNSSNGAFSGRDVKDARKVEVKKNIGIDDLRDIAGSDANQTANSSGIKTLEGEFLNFKTNALFDENLRNDDDRFNRLEIAVQDIRDDFDKMAPAINRLISIESDIKELHKQLSILVNNGSLDEKPVKIASGKTLNVNLPVPERPDPKKKVQPIKSTKTVSSLQISVGDHTNKTRVVFETPKKQNFTINFDAENQLVTVESNTTIPEPLLKKATARSKRIIEASTDLESSNTVAFLTKDILSISKGSYIAPTPQKNYHRYYFDLFYK